jgi:hypothetical protein
MSLGWCGFVNSESVGDGTDKIGVSLLVTEKIAAIGEAKLISRDELSQSDWSTHRKQPVMTWRRDKADGGTLSA